MHKNNRKERFSRSKMIWGFVRKYKTSFFALYICRTIETFLNMTIPVFIALLVDEVIYYKNMDFFWRIALIYAIFMICVLILYTTHPTIWQYLMTRFVFDIRLKLFDRVITARASYLSNAKTGDLVTRITYNAYECMQIIHQNIFEFLNGLLRLVLAIAFIFLYSWKAGILIAVIIPVSLFISRHYGVIASEQSAKASEVYSNYVSWVYEIINGIREIRLMAAEKRSTISFIRHFKEMTAVKIKSSFIHFKAGQLIELVKLASNISLYILIGILALKREVTLGAFIALMDYFTKANDALSYLVNNNMDMQSRKASVDRVYELLNIETEKDNNAVTKIKVNGGEIEFSHVSFAYENREPILNDVNFKINSGEHVSIVGASGTGKTTLAYLLLKFYRPENGKIFIDGIDISKCSLESLRKNIGMVQQDTLIFDGSIRMNLTLGNLQSTDDEILDACNKANISALIKQLPNGLDTIIGKGGTDFSGGQKQRLAIARIYLKNPKILIFDEATSSLDYESEKAVHKAWDDVSKGRTTITIAHRLTTILKSDRVAVLDSGKIVSYDNHLILLETCPYYQNLFKEQYIGQEAELVC